MDSWAGLSNRPGRGGEVVLNSGVLNRFVFFFLVPVGTDTRVKGFGHLRIFHTKAVVYLQTGIQISWGVTGLKPGGL